MIGGRVWVKNSHRRMHPFLSTKNTGMDVTLSFVFCVSTPGLEGFSTERLEDWFNTSVVTNLSQEVGQDISNLIVSYARISSLVASHGVVNREH